MLASRNSFRPLLRQVSERSCTALTRLSNPYWQAPTSASLGSSLGRMMVSKCFCSIPTMVWVSRRASST